MLPGEEGEEQEEQEHNEKAAVEGQVEDEQGKEKGEEKKEWSRSEWEEWRKKKAEEERQAEERRTEEDAQAFDLGQTYYERLADEAKAKLGGSRPVVAATLDELASATEVAAIDLTTTPRFHHTIAVDAFDRGWHVMSEKPLGLTSRACQIMMQAAARNECVLSTAENYRRDPINRLGKALVEAGAIGTPRLMVHHSIGGGDGMLISVWRHQKDQSGVLLDVGVHFADIDVGFIYGGENQRDRRRYE